MMPQPSSFPAIPGFTIESLLGSGSTGSAYLAVQESLQRKVVLKILHREFGDPRHRRRFLREARALARLNHPNLVRIFDHSEGPPNPWLAMEYLDGGTLASRLESAAARNSGGIGVEVTIRIARDLLSALAALHEVGLVHRDVKPANIVLRKNGEAVLTDLGLARDLALDATRVTADGAVIGTIAYLAPECYEGTEPGVATDLFALGVTLFLAMTGVHPTGFTPFGRQFVAPDPCRWSPDCPRWLKELVAALLSPDPAGRPGSARGALAMLPAAALSAAPVVAAAPPRSRRPAVVAAVLVLVGLLAGPGLLRRSDDTIEMALIADSRGARVVASTSLTGLSLCLFDSRDRLVGCVPGEATGRSVTFPLPAPARGARLRGQLLTGLGTPGARPVAQRWFVVPPLVTILGVDPAESPPRLWLRADPPARATWRGEPDAVLVDAGSTGTPWRPGATGPGGKAVLDLKFETGLEASVELSVVPSRSDGPPPPSAEVGFVVSPGRLKRGVVVRSSQVSVVDWAIRSGCRWLALEVDAAGAPTLPVDLVKALRGTGIGLLVELDPGPDPGRAGWERQLLSLPIDGAFPLFYCREARYLRHSELFSLERAHGSAAQIDRWRRFLKEAKPAPDLVCPLFLNSEMLVGASAEELDRSVRDAAGDLEAVSLTSVADESRIWKRAAHTVGQLGRVRGVKTRVRWVWITRHFKLLDQGHPALQTRSSALGGGWSPARSHLLARAHFPEAAIIHDLEDVALTGTGEFELAWEVLELVLNRLRDLRFEGTVSTGGPSVPRIESPSPVVAYRFGGAGAGVQTFFADRGRVNARLFPAAPGVLKIPPVSGKGSMESRLVTTLDPIEITVGAPPLCYVELVRVAARSMTPTPLELR